MTGGLGVSKSGYYEWCARPVSDTEARRDELKKVKIATLFEEFGGVYGYRRIHAELIRAGEQVGPELVRKLMREFGISFRCNRNRISAPLFPAEPEQAVDLVHRDFTADRPDVKWSATSPRSPPGRASCTYKLRGIRRRVGRRGPRLGPVASRISLVG